MSQTRSALSEVYLEFLQTTDNAKIAAVSRDISTSVLSVV
jgi:hypothetical protein